MCVEWPRSSPSTVRSRLGCLFAIFLSFSLGSYVVVVGSADGALHARCGPLRDLSPSPIRVISTTEIYYYIGWVSRCVWMGWLMDGLKSPSYLRSRLSWVAERIQREKWPEADTQLAGVKVSKSRYSISYPFHKPFPSVRLYALIILLLFVGIPYFSFFTFLKIA